MLIKITKKNIITGAAAVVITMTPLVAAAPAYAANGSTQGNNFFSGLIQFIAQKFGLDSTKVQSAVTEYQVQHKTQIQQNMQNREKTRLDALVQQGKITSFQEQAILAELAKLRSEFDPANFRNMTPEERQQQFQKQRDEFTTWAKSQGIDPTLLRPFGMMGLHRGWGRGEWRMGTQATTPTPTQ